MTAPLIYSMCPVKLNSTVLAAADVRLAPNNNTQGFRHSGNPFDSVDVLSSAMPRITFKTPIKDALATIGTGLLVLTNLDVMIAKFSATTYAKESTSVHSKWNATVGCAYISGWSVSSNGICLADVEAVPLSTNGTTHPLARTDNNALLTLSAEPLLHTLGPISINGSVITGLDSISVQFGHMLDVRLSDGDLYPRTAALLAGAPSISGVHVDPATLLTTLSLIGVPINGSSIISYLKSFDATTQLVSTADAISATMAKGRILVDDLTNGQNIATKSNFRIMPLSVSTTHPIIISTSATAPST